MKLPRILLVALALAVPGCGDGEDEGATRAPSARDSATTATAPPGTTEPEADDSDRARTAGTEIALGDSEFGRMLFDSKKQAIYIFERDSEGKTVCYGECAEAWPPVFTKGDPKAGKGVNASLLGTVKRRDGRLQVTYAGQPLYFYAHEGPGEVRCHNVNLNGGLWWVVGPDGKRRP
jgi:predicted lipoprotein with Yx(FWY)xxD motif